jgi:hypothetical protein
MSMTHILAAVIVMAIMAETEIETKTGTGTGTADTNVTATATVVAGSEVETGIRTGTGTGIEGGIEVGTMVESSVYASADLPADSTLRAMLTLRWARAGGGRSRGPGAGITSRSRGQAETGAHEAHDTKEGICGNDNIQWFTPLR